MTNFEVATVGDNCIDRYRHAGCSYVGGNAVNVAVHLSRLGRQAAYFGAVGNDAEGTRVARVLDQNGVSTEFLRILPGVTAYTIIDRNARGDRSFVSEEFGVMLNYAVSADELRLLTRARHVHIGWLNDGGRLSEILAAAGVAVSRDLSVNTPQPASNPVAGLAVAFASADGSDDEVRELARRFVDGGARLAVVMRGGRGAMAADRHQAVFVDAQEIDPVDTTGAGDAFIAGFMNAWINDSTMEQSLDEGRKLATATCLHFGGFPQNAVADSGSRPDNG